ncbi:MAG: RHS repeat-associated core domain-containing protein [Bacteroidales bacterium]
MKIVRKFPVFILLMLLVNSFNLKADWEMISPNPKMINIEVMGDTWFGIEYHGTGTGNIFLSSKNNGHTWDTVPDFTAAFLIRVHKDRILVSAIYKGILGFYLSSDSAKTWQKLTWYYPGSAIDMLLNDTAILMFVSKSSAVESPLYRSLDTGKTWYPLPVEAGDVNWNGNVPAINLRVYGKRIGAFLNAAGFHYSDDGGTTWTKNMEGFPVEETYSAPLSVLSDGFSVRYNYKWYKFNGTSWINQDYKAYFYDTQYDKWKEATNGIPSPNIRAYREPYMFAINGDAGQWIYYSIDGGKKWFQFSVPLTEFQSVFGSSIVISGNYVYAGFTTGFGRRSLSEAINHVIKVEKEKAPEYPISPEEMENLLEVFGADALEELLEAMGIDADELTNDVLADFLNDYLEEGMSSNPFANSQPGVCSYMGMPLWSMNLANLKLFVRDMIFRKKGIGPEVKFAMNYTHSSDSSVGIFGKHWKFEYESHLLQNDSSVVLTTGSGAVFVFSDNKPVVTGASSFSLPCLNNEKYTLHWNGSSWQVEKGLDFEYLNFATAGGNRFVLSSVEDNYGKKLTIAHNAQYHPVTITDGAGREFLLKYSNNLCDSMILPDGRSAVFSYNSRNMLVSSTDLNGVESQYTYDNLRNIIIADIAGKTTQFDYNHALDSMGTVATVFDPEGRKTEYFSTLIDSSSRITNVTYPGNKTFSYKITNGMVSSITNTAGEVKKIFYTSAGKPDSIIWYDGSYLTFTYDSENNILSKRDRYGHITRYGYNSNRKVIFELDAKGDTICSYTYNNKNQLLTIKLSDGNITTFTYDENGELSLINDAQGNTHGFGRDSHGNLVSYTNPLDHTMYYHFSPDGMIPTGKTDFNGNTYTVNYDENGRLNEVVFPDGGKKTYHYDCCSQTGITDENGNAVTVVRDLTNRVLEKTTAEGVSFPVHYNESGFIAGFTTVHGSKKNLAYNARGLLTAVSDEEGTIKYEYNQGGQPVRVTDKLGNQTGLSYSDKGDLKAITDAAGKKNTFEYNSDGRLTSFTNARNQKTSLVYDSKGRVTEKKLNGNTFAAYNYNNAGKMISYSDSSGLTQYTRNALGFVTKITYPGELTVDFEHDPNGNIIKMTYPNGVVVSNTPDKMNRIVNIGWGTSSVDFEYGPSGNLLSETRSNLLNTLYSYNKDNTLTGVNHYASDTVFAGETVVIEDGVIAGLSTKILPAISIIPPKITNISSNKLNQIDQSFFSQLLFPHDADGNFTAFVDKGAYVMSAAYSHDNMLTKINTGMASVKITNDAMRYPRKIVTNGITSNLFYDHKGRLLFETDDTGNLSILYIYRGKRIIAGQKANGQVYFYHYSRNGNTLAITDQAGAIKNAYAYNAHGVLIGKEEQATNRFTFLGAFGAIRLDDNYTLTGARVYSAQTGRYLQRDPLGIITGTNPYLYASNNPIAGIDPLGLTEQEGTVNTQGLDPSSDNDYGTAGGSANPFADDIPDRVSEWNIAKTAISNTLKEFSDHPVSDLLPDALGNPITYIKAADHLSKKEYGKAAWQFVPFNNSMEAAAEYLKEKTKYNDPSKFSGKGIFGEFNNQQTFSCEL